MFIRIYKYIHTYKWKVNWMLSNWMYVEKGKTEEKYMLIYLMIYLILLYRKSSIFAWWYWFLYIYIFSFVSLENMWEGSLSSCRTASTDIPDPLPPLLPIVHRFWQVLRATSRIVTELLYVGSSWSSCFCSPYEWVHRSTSLMSSSLLLQQYPACLVRLTSIVFVMGGRWLYSWCFVGVLPPGLVQNCSQHSREAFFSCRLVSVPFSTYILLNNVWRYPLGPPIRHPLRTISLYGRWSTSGFR